MTDWEKRRSGWQQQPEDARTAFDVDYARIVHSGSFRRLQGKTQTLNLGDSDFYRTRLTHSLEVAQIANSIVRQLGTLTAHKAHEYLPPVSLIQAIGFAHDLGHPPFGHGGEVALNYCMRGNGGFEGNGHTLRILSRLENFSASHGADLARRSLLGVLKYPVNFTAASNPAIVPDIDKRPTSIRVIDRKKSKPPKCYLNTEDDVVAWVLELMSHQDRSIFQSVQKQPDKHSTPLYKSFDCSIMDIADDIAYGVHDLEDAIALALVSERDFRAFVDETKCSTFLDSLKKKYPDESKNNVYGTFVEGLFGDGKSRKHYISRLVHHFITSISIVELAQFSEPLIRYKAVMSEAHRGFLDALQDLVVEKVIRSPNVQHLEFKGQKMVVSVFEALEVDPKSLLPYDAFSAYEASGNDSRIICDHVAGMTDSFLLKTYDRLFSPRMGSVFDKH
ncbi:dGTPase [Mesorhizobium sp. M0051]|uniref:anti-phage deoxyguanosine triphosphatase n=1 Tax=Mesorhizobium sp. M0051 TaxID=2956862 RepID=UPI00333DEB93